MSIIVTKGQPFRFGIKDDTKSTNTSLTIRFVSDPSIEQVKSISPISVVSLDQAYVSVEMSLAIHILSEFPPFEQFTAASKLWPVLVQSRPLIIFINRKYLLQIISKSLPVPPPGFGEQKQLLERRALLRDLEADMARTVAKPVLVPLIIRSEGWNSRAGKLFPEPYQPLPIGKLTDKGVYQRDDYPPTSSNSNISDGDDMLAGLDHGDGIIIVFVDELQLPNARRWPEVLDDQIPPHLTSLLKKARVVVVDDPKRKQAYERSLSRDLHSFPCTLGSLLPLPGQSIPEAQLNTKITAFCSEVIKPNPSHQQSLPIQFDDYTCFADFFSELYPDCSDGGIGASAAFQDAHRIFRCSDHETDSWIRFSAGSNLPLGPSDRPGIARLVFGSLAHIVQTLFSLSSRTLLLRSSDLASIGEIGSVVDASSLPAEKGSILLLRLSSCGSEILRIGSNELFCLLRQLRNQALENPYRLEKTLTSEQRVMVAQLHSNARLLIVSIELP